MSTNKKVGLLVLQNAFHLRHVMARIAANVGHVDINVFNMEVQVFGILHAHDVVVDVAMHSTQRLETSQGICSFDIANITRMPQLVNILKEIEKLRNQGTMRIR